MCYVLIVQTSVQIIDIPTTATVLSVNPSTSSSTTTIQPYQDHQQPASSISDTTATVINQSSTATIQPSQEHQKVEPAANISHHQPAASKRKSFFGPKTTNKQPRVSNTHTELSTMAKSKCVQMDEQINIMKAREDREKELQKLQIEKTELELAMLREKEKRDSEAHAVDMQIKQAQLKLLMKQVQEE